MPTTPIIPAYVCPQQVFEFDIYTDPRVTHGFRIGTVRTIESLPIEWRVA